MAVKSVPFYESRQCCICVTAQFFDSALCWPDHLNFEKKKDAKLNWNEARLNKIERKKNMLCNCLVCWRFLTAVLWASRIRHISAGQPKRLRLKHSHSEKKKSDFGNIRKFWDFYRTHFLWHDVPLFVLPALLCCVSSPSLPIKGLPASSRSAQRCHVDGGRRVGDRWVCCLTAVPLDMSVWWRKQTWVL